MTEYNKIDPLMDGKSLVQLISTLPSEKDEMTMEEAIVNNARQSYTNGTKKSSSNTGLIRYLIRHYHTSPLEVGEFLFQIRAPLAVCIHMLRHRTANINAESARYSIISSDFYIPNRLTSNTKHNKQASEETELDASIITDIEEASKNAYLIYEQLLDKGLSREQARFVLPQNIYVNFSYKMDLHNLLKFLRLRTADDAQWETQQYAKAMAKFVEEAAPNVYEAYKDFWENSISLSSREQKVLSMMNSEGISANEAIEKVAPEVSKGEKRETIAKLASLFDI